MPTLRCAMFPISRKLASFLHISASMLPLYFILGWAGVWAAFRLLLGLAQPVAASRSVHIELEWWRATCEAHSDDGGLLGRLGARHRLFLRRWFACGAAAGLLAAACSVALLGSELYTLLRGQMPAQTAEAVAARAVAGTGPRLQLAIPGVTLPFSHAAPLWLALAVSLALHEVCVMQL